MKGFRPVKLGIKFHKEIMGIRKNLHHQVKRAEPMTVELLTKMQAVIDFTEDKNVAVWTCMLTGFHLVLRKSNLVPLSKMHDTVRNISRNNVRYDQGLMIVYVDWSKTNQYREFVNKSPMMGNNNDPICPVRWNKYMCDRIPAKPYHNLFCYKNKKGQIVPVTYYDLMKSLRGWLQKVGVKNSKDYSLHSLRRGASMHAFKSGVAERTIMQMGGWKSNCYRRYIEVGVDSRLAAWKRFTNNF